jgi:GWxTD domain-containing protein
VTTFRTHRTLLLLFVPLLAATAPPLRAQRDYPERPAENRQTHELLRYGDVMYVEAEQLPSDSADLCRLDVVVRISYDYLVFVRGPSADPDSSYVAGASVSIELYTERNEPLSFANFSANAATQDFATTNTRARTLLFRQPFYVREGTYRLLITVSDRESTRERRFTMPVHLRALAGPRLVINAAIPVAFDGNDLLHPRMIGFGHSVLYGTPAWIAVASGPVEPDAWSFELRRQRPDEDRETVSRFTLEPRAVLRDITGDSACGLVPSLPFVERLTAGRLTIFRLPIDTLDPGRYDLVVRATKLGDRDTIDAPLRIFWREMPLSLQDLDFARSAMEHILTDEQYDDLMSGSDEERDAKFRAYWKAHDPDPSTPRNEAMEEYFRRVDQAYYKFQTLDTPNGAATDRGKVYILFGPPDDVRRSLKSGEPLEEVWHYRDLRRTFWFSDKNRNGDLRLVRQLDENKARG